MFVNKRQHKKNATNKQARSTCISQNSNKRNISLATPSSPHVSLGIGSTTNTTRGSKASIQCLGIWRARYQSKVKVRKITALSYHSFTLAIQNSSITGKRLVAVLPDILQRMMISQDIRNMTY